MIGSNGRVIEIRVPDYRDDDADSEKYKTRNEDAAIDRQLFLGKLSLAILCVNLMICSSHRDERLNNVSKNESDPDKSALVADVQQCGKHRKEDSRNEEGVREYLNVNPDTVGEEALHPDHAKGDQRCYGKANYIFF